MNFFIKTLQNCDNQSFQEYFREKVCFNESLFTYNGKKALGVESSARGCFVEKKILYFRNVFGETNHIGGLFSKGRLQEPLQKMEHFPTRLNSLQTLATVAKSSIFTYDRSSETTSDYENKWRQRSLNYELYPEAATGGVL